MLLDHWAILYNHLFVILDLTTPASIIPMATVLDLNYRLECESNLNWTSTQERAVSKDYPFSDLLDETAEQFVVRVYLQCLWLPDVIAPLHILVPSLLRVKAVPSSQFSDANPHPLHLYIDPLLLTSRASANKYHLELPQILADGGGAGEIEEAMMYFALNYERTDGEGEAMGLNGTGKEGQWFNESWKKQWLDRLERRELVQRSGSSE
jgi:hypothetical protein